MKYFTLSMALLGMTISACTDDATPAICGDGQHDSNEQCDDGNNVSGDGCTAECTIEVAEGCGDGELGGEEECDEGGETSTCDFDCSLVACGDSIRNEAAGEACDDGNTVNGDGCSDDCLLELPSLCGDGNVDEGEDCDEGEQTDTCDDDCTAAICGDGTLNESAGEACDDGNTVGGDGCSSTCQPEAMSCGLGGLDCSTIVMGMTDMSGSTDMHDAYPCLVDVDKSGSEVIYEWVATTTGTVYLFNETVGGVDLIVTEASNDCSLGACLAAGTAGASFDAVMGTRYLIIIDSDPGPAQPFYVGMSCP